MHEQRSYWQGVKARMLPTFAVGLAAAVGAWLADDDVRRLALLVVVLVAFAAGVLLPPRLSRRDDKRPDA